MTSLNIDHMDALSLLEDAYSLLFEFEKTVDTALDGDHPNKDEITLWCDTYEKYKRTE